MCVTTFGMKATHHWRTGRRQNRPPTVKGCSKNDAYVGLLILVLGWEIEPQVVKHCCWLTAFSNVLAYLRMYSIDIYDGVDRMCVAVFCLL
jgi:hypothetical protein